MEIVYIDKQGGEIEWWWIARGETMNRKQCMGMCIGLLVSMAGAEPVRWTGNGHLYEPVSVSGTITWPQAQQAAINAGGYLATITSQAENDFVFSLINSDAYWFAYGGGYWSGPWIGGMQAAGSAEPAGGWGWISGEPFGYSNWDTGQPNNANTNENRIHFGFATSRTSKWNDVAETFGSVKAYVIEYDTYYAKPRRWWEGNNHLYQVVATSQPISWTQAQQAAEAAGGYLATITSAEENAAVMQWANYDLYWKISGGSNIGPWLGGYQISGSAEPAGGWAWITGEPFIYTNWDLNVPDNEGGHQDYLHFGYSTPRNGKWNDLEENGKGLVYSYVVEYEVYHGPVIPWSADLGGNGHSYQAVGVPAGITWTQANDEANAAGGYLVTLTSAAENDFVFSLVDRGFFWEPGAWDSYQWLTGPWLGGIQAPNSPEPAGGWGWVTGEPSSYMNWETSGPWLEPSNDYNNGLYEDVLLYFTYGTVRRPSWGDWHHSFKCPGYIIEYSEPYCLPGLSGDLNGDCTVNLADLAEMAGQWLRCNRVPISSCD
jgi:hypothetical protein